MKFSRIDACVKSIPYALLIVCFGVLVVVLFKEKRWRWDADKEEVTQVVTISSAGRLIEEMRMNPQSKLSKLLGLSRLLLVNVSDGGVESYGRFDFQFVGGFSMTPLAKKEWSELMLGDQPLLSVSIKRVSATKLSYVVGEEEYEFNEVDRKFKFVGRLLAE